MANLRSPGGRTSILLLLAVAICGCDDNLNTSFPRPASPFDGELFDVIEGPVDRASAFDLVPGRGIGIPREVRVDQSVQWDIAFAVIEGEPVWVPRGFFDGIEASSGIQPLAVDFEDVMRLSNDRDEYEMQDPVPITVGTAYAIRSRTDPTLSLPCHIYAKLVVDAVEGTPSRVRYRYLWNPNCDDTNVTPGEGL